MALIDKQKQVKQQPKKIKTSDKTCSVPMIPDEIIVNILCRLPVKLLLRYKSVCKLWCSLISDSYLIKSHLSLSASNPHPAHHQLILTISSFNINLLSCGLYEVVCDHKSVNVLELDHPFVLELDDPFKRRHSSTLIVGSCNGLLCVAIDHVTLYICNPSTRKSNMLPYRHVNVSYGWSVIYGFGYDESNDDYKVVEVSYKANDMYDNEVKIYSLKSGFWRKVGKFPFSPRRISIGAFGMFLNGALHWGITKQYGPSPLWTIVSLDLAKETFNEILQPVYDDSKYLTPLDTSRGFSLGVLGEWLCVLRDYLGRHVDV